MNNEVYKKVEETLEQITITTESTVTQETTLIQTNDPPQEVSSINACVCLQDEINLQKSQTSRLFSRI